MNLIKRPIFFLILFIAFNITANAQRSKVISVFHLIEAAKYEDAKKAIEESIADEKTAKWHMTWYARGLLSQTAYLKGMADKDKKKSELYPDQLYVAYESFEKAIELDHRGKLNTQLQPLYVQLANEFQKLGDKHFQTKNYAEAQRAYEYAQLVINSPVISARTDSNLIYNTALAAWENKDWEKATAYLDQLNTAYYSPNVSHLLYFAHLQSEDTLAAKNALVDGIERYEENEELVLLLVDLLVRENNIDKAIEVLDTAALVSPSKHIYPFTKGVVYQKAGQFNNAIEAYQEALQIAPDEAGIHSNIGTCYYNIGVEVDENARTIINKSGFLAEKEKAKKAFESAAESFRRVLEKDADNSYATSKLYQLSKVLGITENTN